MEKEVSHFIDMKMQSDILKERHFHLFKYKGFMCAIVRIPIMGHLCGYVALPKSNSAFGIDYNDINITCHGGLTYATDTIWNIDKDVFEELWWIGFDTAHCDDAYGYCDNTLYRLKDDSSYKNYDYVLNEIHAIVEQLIARIEDGTLINKAEEE